MTEIIDYMTLPPLDLAAVAICLICWTGYFLFADRYRRGTRNLMTVMHAYRVKWMERMLDREIRIGDTNILMALNRSNQLFASTSVVVVAGLVTVLGALDKARILSSHLSFVSEAPRAVWEVKILALIFVFGYAFFKFIWSLRQFNFALQLIGAAPAHDDKDAPDRASFPQRAARIVTLGVDTFNGGVRAYYFGLAMMSWFIHPYVFIAASVWVVLVLYRREFRSRTLATLSQNLGE